MSALAQSVADDVVGNAPFFAPAATDMLDGLLGQYNQAKGRIKQVASFAAGEAAESVLHYFVEGNQSDDRGRRSLALSAKQLFDEAGAIGALNSAYWSKALALTDVLDLMPQARRNEWHKQIMERQCPDFDERTVRATLTELLGMRAKFFGERVDGIFRGLSGEHVTNAPEAFGKRMIIARVLGSYGTVEHSTSGLINDLRCVIAKFMGRGEPSYGNTSPLISSLKARWGEWVEVDGGALRIRLYKKGTAHLEVHPDMAWRLNRTLASLYPLAIPPEFRQRPKKQAKNFEMMKRPLPFPVLEMLASMGPVRTKVNDWPERWSTVPNTLQFYRGIDGEDSPVGREACRVLQALGGTKADRGWVFDYAPGEVINEVVTSGCIPDRVAHQFYPTPPGLAERLVGMAAIGDSHKVLEPSAGMGGLADLLPASRTTCVEIAPLHCKVLAAKGHTVVQGDFIAWADATNESFDRVVMNPPFSDGRWQVHVERAAALLRPGGRLVAIVPAGAPSRAIDTPGLELRWHGPFSNEFAGTSVSVAILEADVKA
jgi:hypothetical protein